MAKEDDAADSKPAARKSPAKPLDESQLRTKQHDSIIPTAQVELGPRSLPRQTQDQPGDGASAQSERTGVNAAPPVIKGFESAPPASTRVPESVARLSERGGSLSDGDRWAAAGALKKALAEGDESAIEAELAKLPVAQLAYRIADVYSIATTGFSGPLLYARAGGVVEALLLEFEAESRKK